MIGVSVDAQRYAAGSACTVFFSTTAGGVSHVNLDLSRDAGATWESLAASVPLPFTLPSTGDAINGDEYLWTVTHGGGALPQTNCLIRVSDAADSSFLALSDPFVIRCKTIWYADASAPAGGDGLSWATAYQHPQDAGLAVVAVGDEVWVAAGTYTRLSGWSEVLSAPYGVSVYGGFAGTETERTARDWRANATIFDGEGVVSRVVFIADGNVNTVLDGFTITGGNADGSDNCGGGILIWRISESGLVISNCVIAGNAAEADGGGLYVRNGPLVVENCVFSSNTAGRNGGGIGVAEGVSPPTITNCIFAGNSAGSYGGGVHDQSFPAPAIRNCTFWGNSAVSAGSAMYRFGMSPGIVANCIFWSNAGSDAVNPMYDVTYSNVQGGRPGAGNIDSDPLFVNASGGDFRLSAGSPCIDAADGDAAPAQDLDGNTRVDDPATADTGVGTPPYTDMGAYEYQP